MPYLAPDSLSLAQGTRDTAGACTVAVSWAYGDLDCDAVDVLWHTDPNACGQEGRGLTNLPTRGGSLTSVDLSSVPVAATVWVGVFPKKHDEAGGWLCYLPDDHGEQVFMWLVHGILLPISTHGVPLGNAPRKAAS